MGDIMKEMDLFGSGVLSGDIIDRQSTAINLTNKEMQQVNLAKRIRKVVQSRNFKIDETEHYHNTNKILYSFLRACGFTPYSFVIDYLGSVQPFYLEIDEGQSYGRAIKCIIDPTYKIPLYVKIDFTQHNECLISFHENQFTRQSRFERKIDKYVVVIPDQIIDTGLQPLYKVNIYRGMESLEVSGNCTPIKDDLVKVRHKDFLDVYEDYLVEKLNKLWFFDDIESLSPEDFSFTTYGSDRLYDLSMLFDYYLSGIDVTSKRVCVNLISGIVYDMSKDNKGIEDLQLFLDRTKYIDSSNKYVLTEHLERILNNGKLIRSKNNTRFYR